MGSHSTPNDIMAARSRSHSRSSSHTAHTTLAPLPSRISSHGQFNGSRGHGDQTGVDSSSSRSSLPLTHTPADRTEDSLDLPSGLQSPDITIPTIPNRPTHSPLHRYSGPIQPDDVFSASYAPVRLNRPPPGLSFHADPGADGVDEHDQLVRMAEAEAGQSSHDDWSGPDEHGDGDTGERDEEAIRDMMFPGMVDMLWPVISSSDIPSGERDSALDLEEGEGHADEDSISGPVGNARGRGYVDFDMPVKGTPYRLGVARDGGTANLASLTCDARDTRSSGTPVPRRQSARRPMKPSEATSGSDSSNGSRMLKSAMKHSSLVSPIKTPRPIKSILRTTPGASYGIQSIGMSSDEYTSSEQAHTDGGKSTASRTEGGESTTGGDDTGNMDVVWSFDQPLRGDTMDFTPRSASDAIRTPTRSDSARKEISSRPKTPIHLGAHVSRSKTMMLQSDTDDESVRSTPIPHVGRAEEETPARNHTDQRGGARAGQKRLDREVEVGDRTVGLDKRPVLDRTLSELLQSDDEEGDDELPFLPEGARTAMRPAAEVELTVPSPDAVLDVARGRRGHSSGGTPGLAAVESLTRRKRRPGGKSTEEKGDQSRLFDMTLSQLLRTSSDAGDLDNVGQTPQTQTHHVGATPTRPRHTSSAVHARRIDTPRPPRSTARMEHRFSSAKPRNTVKDAHVSAHRSRPAVNVDEVNDIEISRSKPTRPAEGGQMSSVLDAVDTAASGMDGDCNAPVGFDMHDGDDEDEYEPLMDFIDIPDERKKVGRESRQGADRQREQSVQSCELPRATRLWAACPTTDHTVHSPAPWTPSSHRGSPAPWQHDHSSSPLTFSPSLSPMRLLTPPLELPTIGLATAGKRRRYDGETTSGRQKVKGRKMKRKGAWRGEEVMRRMEEGDREEAEFWLWVQNDGVAIRGGSTRGTNKRSHGSRVDTDDGSGRDLDDDLDAGSLSVALDGRGKGTQSRARKKIKRDQVLQALYDTEVSYLLVTNVSNDEPELAGRLPEPHARTGEGPR